MVGGLIVAIIATFSAKEHSARPLDDLFSRPGLLFLAAWMFLAIGFVVFLGILWPVISTIWSQQPIGLEADFYNKVCLPLFALISVFLVFCPWLGWKGGIRDKKMFYAVCAATLPATGFFWMVGVRHPVALMGAVAACVGLAGIVGLFMTRRDMLRNPSSLAAYGVHVGLLLMTLGIAFSGPYKVENEAVLEPGQSMQVAEYTVTYKDSEEVSTPGMAYFEVLLSVDKDGKHVGELTPQRRAYRNNKNVFAEVSVIPGLGDEIYATLIGSTKEGSVSLRISVNPLVNWIWIGGTLMSILPLLAFRRRKA
jgi:cytochrome c-type biogenesis protein CcmF